MFAIFGISKKLAAKEVDKKLRNINSSFAQEYKALSQDEQKATYEEEMHRLFDVMKPKQVSGDLSTPETAKDMLAVMKRDPSFKDLQIKASVPARDSAGQIKRSKTNNKILRTWVALADYDRHLELFETAA
jgi:hypothetical protein